MTTPYPTVGRDEELALLADALRSGRSAVIAGAAGVGKTHVARRLSEQASAWAWTSRWVMATRAASTVPLGAFGPMLSPGADQGVSRLDMLQRAAHDVMGTAPVLVTVDDAHLLDDASAALVHHLSRTEGAAVLVTVRSGEPCSDAVAALWKDGGGIRLELQSLSELETGMLVEGLVGGHVEGATVHRLWAASEGNALWLRELVLGGLEREVFVETGGLWHWSGSLVHGSRLTELIADRLRGLTDAETTAVQVVAMGDGAPLAVVEQSLTAIDADLAAASGDPLESLERRGLLRIEADGNRWFVGLAHTLHTETVRARTPRRRQQRAVRALATALSETGARRRDDVLRFATWGLEGGTAVAPEELAAAAKLAATRFDRALAVRLLDAAVARGAAPRIHMDLAHALFACGRVDDAEAVLARVDTPDSAAEAADRALMGAMIAWYGRGRVEEADRALVAAAAECSPGATRDHLVASRATLLSEAGRPAEAAQIVEPILRRGSELRTLVRARHALVWALPFCGRADEADQLADVALQDALRLSDPLAMPAAAVLLGRCRAHWIRGELDAAERLAADNHRHAVVRGAQEVRPLWEVMLGRLALMRGRIDDAVRILRDCAAVLAEHDLHAIQPSCLGLLASALGQAGVAAAADVAEDAAAVLQDRNRLWQPDVVAGQAWAAVASGEPSRGVTLLVEEGRRADASGLAGFAMLLLHDAVRAGGATWEGFGEVCARVDGPLAAALASAAAAATARDADALTLAAAALRGLGALLWAAEAEALAARQHRGAGRTGSALAAAARARELAEACPGARTPALTALDEPTAVALLSAREQEIAALAAQGLSRRDIAERLVISVRTVGNHLYNVYGKLGVATRAELAAALGGGPAAADAGGPTAPRTPG